MYSVDLSRVRLVATDFDGVHTDGMVYVTEQGVESVRVNRRDGLGYDMLRKAAIHTCIISKEMNTVVAARARKLNVACYSGVRDGEGKLGILKSVAASIGLSTPEEVVYIGDDVNDIQALEWAGIPICPADADLHVLRLVRSRRGYVTHAKGGEGVIREVVEQLLKAKGLPFEF